jgi:putative endonuclease
MYTTYVLKSKKNNFLYVGSTENLNKRFEVHNKGQVKSTKAYRPWEIIETRTFNTRSEAMKEEKFLKTGQQKELLKRKYSK